MKIRNQKDFWSAVMFVVFGVLFIVWSTEYQFGSTQRMGPGYFPLLLGILLTEVIHPFVAGGIAFVLFILFLRLGRPFNSPEIHAIERVMGARAVRLLKGFAA